jgi:hypothetical protein
MMGRQIEVTNLTRCSRLQLLPIIEMRRRNFLLSDQPRDRRHLDRSRLRAVFLVDDNVTIDVPRLEALYGDRRPAQRRAACAGQTASIAHGALPLLGVPVH